MKEVNIYIRTSLTGPCIKDGRWAAAMECQTSKGPAVKGICGEEQETTYYRLVLLGIVKSLKILNAPCNVTLYTDCIFIKNMIENGKPEQWKRAEWRKPSGEEVKNQELWQQYQTLSERHEIAVRFSKHDVFGNFDSVEELNACAKGLLEEQDLEHLKVLAEENGIPDGIREVYEQHLSEELVDSVNAAIGKLQVELKEETDGMPAGEIVSYLSMRCFEKEILARAVRRKNRTLKECLQNIRKEVEKRVKERRGAQMVAMPDLEVFAMAEEYYLEAEK